MTLTCPFLSPQPVNKLVLVEFSRKASSTSSASTSAVRGTVWVGDCPETTKVPFFLLLDNSGWSDALESRILAYYFPAASRLFYEGCPAVLPCFPRLKPDRIQQSRFTIARYGRWPTCTGDGHWFSRSRLFGKWKVESREPASAFPCRINHGAFGLLCLDLRNMYRVVIFGLGCFGPQPGGPCQSCSNRYRSRSLACENKPTRLDESRLSCTENHLESFACTTPVLLLLIPFMVHEAANFFHHSLLYSVLSVVCVPMLR